MHSPFENRQSWTTSNLGRALDPAYKTNLAVVVLTIAAGAATTALGLLRSEEIVRSLITGGMIGLYLFLCWALTREIDPDHEGAAFLSMAAGLALLTKNAEPALLIGFWLLGLLRVLNHTPGRPTTRLDSLALAVASLWLAWKEDWILGVVGGVIFTLDGFLDNPVLRHRWQGGLLIVLGLAFYLARPGPIPVRSYPSSGVWMILAVSLLFIPLILGSRRIKSRADTSDHVLNARRIQVTQLSLLVTAILLLTRVQDGWGVSLVAWAVLIGAGVWYAGYALARSFRDCPTFVGTDASWNWFRSRGLDLRSAYCEVCVVVLNPAIHQA